MVLLFKHKNNNKTNSKPFDNNKTCNNTKNNNKTNIKHVDNNKTCNNTTNKN